MFEVEDQFAGREQFAVGMERSGCCRSLLWGEGLSNAQPREGEFHGRHRSAASAGGGAFELAGRGVGGLGCSPARTGSALVSMEVGIRAELGSADMRILVPGCWYSKRLPRGRWEVVRLTWGHPPAAPVSEKNPLPHPFVALSVASNYAHVVISGVGLQLVIKGTGLGHWFGR